MASAMLVAMASVAACGDDTAQPLGSDASSPLTTVTATTTEATVDQASSTSVDVGSAEQPLIREMTADEWSTFSGLEDDGMVCPEPNMKAGDQFWDYSGEIDPSEYGRQPGDALLDAIVEMNDSYRRETGQTRGFLEEVGWTGLRHGEPGIIYFVYPEVNWQHIVTVTGSSATGAWRHQKATVCVVVP